ncbi:MAG: GGDEF domain-containing protein [Candidatus Omnitrophica bacterium]|nr:GGDEF domain-containing protein [Candidatus Omnitrophota bacterium]
MQVRADLSAFMMTKHQRVAVVCVVMLCVTVIGLSDYFSGTELSLSIFYLMPISACAWFVSAGAALITALVCETIEFFVNVKGNGDYSYYVIPVWNAVMRFLMYVSLAASLNALKKQLWKEKSLARTDPLTGLPNARHFYEVSEAERKKSERFKRPLSLAYIDVDNFKQINDTFGHSAGDEVLSGIGKTIRLCIRGYDMAARIGGDEFVILFPETDCLQAAEVMKKIQQHLRDSGGTRTVAATFSIGVVTFTHSAASVNEMIKQADAAMYRIKNTSKNDYICIEADFGEQVSAEKPRA